MVSRELWEAGVVNTRRENLPAGVEGVSCVATKLI
jgi:hypothetical protein